MRIIAGAAKGTPLAAPKHGTRPMTGRARESLFSILGSHLHEAVVLDLYAGTGSLGLEALSRGASDAVFVEQSREAAGLIDANIDAVGLGGSVLCMTVDRAITRLNRSFDVVFVDPPYDDADASVETTLGSLGPVLNDGGLVVLHRQARSVVEPPDFLTSTDQRRYGDAVVTIMERTEP